jgi:hypothetical protein
MRSVFAVIMCAATALAGAGCRTAPPTLVTPHPAAAAVVDPTPDVEAAKQAVETESATILSQTPVIREQVLRLPDVYAAIKGVILTSLGRIDAAAMAIRNQSERLAKVEADIAAMRAEITKRDDAVRRIQEESAKREEAWRKERETLMAEKDAALGRAMLVLIAVGIAFIGIGVFFLIQGASKLGIGLAASGAAVSGGAVAVYKLSVVAAWIAVGAGGLGGVALTFAGIYFLFRGLGETVHTTEMAKEKLTPEAKAALFGEGATPGKAFEVQSSTTEGLVSKIREKKGFAK